MFVLEIDFHDGSNDVECLLVRRPKFVVGASKTAHVIVDEMKGLGYEMQFARGLGRRFRCVPLPVGDVEGTIPSFLENGYNSDANFNLGPISMRVSSLDSDLLMRETDPPDKAGARILRQACAFQSPTLPAIVSLDATPLAVSFSPEQTIMVGRSNKCLLRVDSPDVSAEHARIGYESGQFWIEDLGSTNGTFIDQQQISGRQSLPARGKITIGGQTTLTGVVSEDQLLALLKANPDDSKSLDITPQKSTYPALVAVSDLVRPSKFILQPGTVVLLGRDPESDIWVGAPHISRKHCSVTVTKTGHMTITDLSRNGIAWEGGVLPKDAPFVVEPTRQVFDLGGGVNIAICFNSEDEEAYRSNRGSFLIAEREQKVREAGTRVDLKTLLDQAPEQRGVLSQEIGKPEPINEGLLISIVRRFRHLGARDRAFAILFLVSLSVIVVVTVNLILQGFN